MNARHLACVVLAVVAIQAPPVATASAEVRARSPQAALDDLLAADRAFADLASRTNVVNAMAAMLDEDVLMPVPNGGFARGRADALNAMAATGRALTARADWAPVRGGLSADGRHGFSWGYMTVRVADGSLRLAKYLSYWVRRPEGWRVALYRRAPRPEGEVDMAMLEPALPARLVAPSRAGASRRSVERSLDSAERAFSDDAQRLGLGPAFARWGSADAANMGRGPSFRIGAASIAADMPAEVPSGVRWAPEGVLVASSGDLGVTWGWIHPNAPVADGRPAAFPYFTVWRRATPSEPWRYVAE
jgi:ketosteroid isomerase-like protein